MKKHHWSNLRNSFLLFGFLIHLLTPAWSADQLSTSNSDFPIRIIDQQGIEHNWKNLTFVAWSRINGEKYWEPIQNLKGRHGSSDLQIPFNQIERISFTTNPKDEQLGYHNIEAQVQLKDGSTQNIIVENAFRIEADFADHSFVGVSELGGEAIQLSQVREVIWER